MKQILYKVINKDAYLQINYRIIIPVIFLLVISLVLLRSTSADMLSGNSTFSRQLIWILIGFLAFIIIQYINVNLYNEYAYHAYILLILLLFTTYFMPIVGGARRWLVLGPISFQPSEIGKLVMVFSLSRYLCDQNIKKYPIKSIISSIILTIIPTVLVFRQPDLGTSIIYVTIIFPMLYWSGIKSYYIFLFLAPIISIIAAFNLMLFYLWMAILILVLFYNQPKLFHGALNFTLNVLCGLLAPIIWHDILYDHQRSRVEVFLNPLSDPHGSGYQIIQSLTAIGSGGLWGKGFNQGTQTQLKFLPVRDTDFIISVLGEEYGFFGISFLLVTFMFMIYWILNYCEKISNQFLALTLIGLSTILFSHMIINMGMTVGLFPVTGLPAPFISYGGTFLLTCLMIVGLINSIISQR